jgi:hypothetical protein
VDDQWKKDAEELLKVIGGDESYQKRVLSGTLPTVRTTLRGTRFEVIGDDDLTTIIAIATTAIRGGEGPSR